MVSLHAIPHTAILIQRLTAWLYSWEGLLDYHSCSVHWLVLPCWAVFLALRREVHSGTMSYRRMLESILMLV